MVNCVVIEVSVVLVRLSFRLKIRIGLSILFIILFKRVVIIVWWVFLCVFRIVLLIMLSMRIGRLGMMICI